MRVADVVFHLGSSLSSGQISASLCKESKYETQNNSCATFKIDQAGPSFVQVPTPASTVAYQITPECSGVKQPLLMLTDSVGQEFGQGTVKRVCLCSCNDWASAG